MKTLRPKERESDILRTIMDGLSAMHIFHLRMNSGAMFGAHAGKKWAVRFGRRGMADILALKHYGHCSMCGTIHSPIWIEVKRPGGMLSPDQAAFRDEVEAQGHIYLIATSWESILQFVM